LPLSPPHRAAGPGRHVSRKLSILLVDDDPLVRINASYMLMDLGHSVREAQSAAHALQLLDSDALFDVVVTDYAMPGMSGLDLATRIRRSQPDLPIVLATGYAEVPSHTRMSFPRLGKPYTQEELTRALEAAINPNGSGY
jgi:CheY-like chemotaxis protein